MWCTDSERNMSFVTQNGPLTYAKSKGPDQPVHPRRLIQAFARNSVISIKTGIQNPIHRPRWLCWICIRLVIRRLRVRSLLGRQQSFVEIDHEIISTVILSLPLGKKGSCQFMAKEYAHYWLTAKRTKRMPSKSAVK